MTSDTPTEERATESDGSTARPDRSMGGVDHTHPDRNTTFGSIFGRGPSVAADGGEPAGGGRSSSDRRSDGGEPASGRRSSSDRRSDGGEPATPVDPDAEDVMEDVDHEAPSETGANATFERGAEHGASDPADVTDPVDEATDE